MTAAIVGTIYEDVRRAYVLLEVDSLAYGFRKGVLLAALVAPALDLTLGGHILITGACAIRLQGRHCPGGHGL